MLYKYLGEAFDSSSNAALARSTCLSDGLFRITQPALLNDKTGEFRAAVYYNKFAPADYEWARKEERKHQIDPTYQATEDDLEMFLRPMGIRYAEAMPHMLPGPSRSIEDYDRARAEEIAQRINATAVGVFSTLFGVLSLCDDPANKLMWTHYGAEGRGLVVGLDPAHASLSRDRLRPVSYDPVDRASITYFKGTVRLNGRWVYPDPDGSRLLSMLKNHHEFRSMMDRFVYAKEIVWAYEREHRLLVPLSERDSEVNPSESFRPELPADLATLLHDSLPVNPVVCLKRIPFEAFKEVILGYGTSKASEEKVRERLDKNPRLKHVAVKRMVVSPFSELVARAL